MRTWNDCSLSDKSLFSSSPVLTTKLGSQASRPPPASTEALQHHVLEVPSTLLGLHCWPATMRARHISRSWKGAPDDDIYRPHLDGKTLAGAGFGTLVSEAVKQRRAALLGCSVFDARCLCRPLSGLPPRTGSSFSAATAQKKSKRKCHTWAGWHEAMDCNQFLIAANDCTSALDGGGVKMVEEASWAFGAWRRAYIGGHFESFQKKSVRWEHQTISITPGAPWEQGRAYFLSPFLSFLT